MTGRMTVRLLYARQIAALRSSASHRMAFEIKCWNSEKVRVTFSFQEEFTIKSELIQISPSEQSNQPYGLKNRLPKPLFSGSGCTCSGIGIRLFSITQFSVASCTSAKPCQSAFKYSITSVLYKPFTVSSQSNII